VDDKRRGKCKIIYSFVVNHPLGSRETYYIEICTTYGKEPLKIGNTFNTVMGIAYDFNTNNLPINFYFDIHPHTTAGRFFLKNNEMWCHIAGKEKMVLDSWQIKVLKTIQKQEKDKYGT
jgi:hypothetical protein